MPILVRHGHFLNDLLDVFVCRLNCPIHLGPIGRGIVMLDLEILTHLFHHFVVQIGGIVSDNLPRQPVPAHYLPFDEPNHHAPCYTSV